MTRNRTLVTCPFCGQDQHLYAKKFVKHEVFYFGSAVKCRSVGLYPKQAKQKFEELQKHYDTLSSDSA